MSFLGESFAIARKEIILDLRFSLQFFLQSITSPLTRLIPLLFVYTAILRSQATPGLPGIAAETYLPFLVLGTLFHTVWTAGATIFQEKFLREKYWQTIDLLFLVPIRTSAVVVGFGFAVLVRLAPTILFFILTLAVVSTPTVSGFVLALLAIVLTLGVGLAVGIFFGGVALATENVTPFTGYFVQGVSLLSAFFYPLETLALLPAPLSTILVPIVRVNPLYAGVTFARAAWLSDPVLPWADLFFLGVTFVLLVPFSTTTFRLIWRKFGIQG